MNKPLGDMETGREGYHQLIESDNFRLVVAILALALGPVSHAQEPAQAPTLAELAAQADVVALAQVEDTDYRYRREYPYRGSAFLEVLIAYKGEKLPERLEVYEEGLHPFECYFEQPEILAEGRRYMVFLRADPDEPGRYRGLPAGCALDVLVTESNRYAVRMPADGIELANDLSGLAEPMTFADRYAVEDEESINPARRDALLQAGALESQDGVYRYTRGIDLSRFRALMELPLR